MNVIWRACDLLGPGETAIVISTTGLNLTLNRDGSGSTGYWKLDSTRQVDRVIVLQKVEHREGLTADVFSGEFAGFEGPNPDGRFLVLMRAICLAGVSPCTLQDFVSPGQNPVRYLPIVEGD